MKIKIKLFYELIIFIREHLFKKNKTKNNNMLTVTYVPLGPTVATTSMFSWLAANAKMLKRANRQRIAFMVLHVVLQLLQQIQ
jgi:hypothetical protein